MRSKTISKDGKKGNEAVSVFGLWLLDVGLLADVLNGFCNADSLFLKVNVLPLERKNLSLA